MKCCVLNCPSHYDKTKNSKKSKDFSMHGFPTEEATFLAWVAATGIPNFVPKINSKICSKHFDEDAYYGPNRLKRCAVPTIFPTTTNTSRISPSTTTGQREEVGSFRFDYNAKVNETDLSPNSDPLACNLSSNDSFNTSQFPEDHPSTSGLALQAPKLPQTNDIEIIKENVVTPSSFQTKNSFEQSVIYLQESIFSPKCPIKVVDVKKLLQNPPTLEEKNEISKPQMKNNSKDKIVNVKSLKVNKMSSKTIKKKPSSSPSSKGLGIQNRANTNAPADISQITVSHVLECLKLFWPSTVQLSRLRPDKKVVSLVLQYFKLADYNIHQSVISVNLKIIVDAAKAEEKVYRGESHPYHKVADIPLQIALARVLPDSFSMVDVSCEILKCICIILSLDIFTDGFYILRSKIRKFSSEGRKFNEIINGESEKKEKEMEIRKEVITQKNQPNVEKGNEKSVSPPQESTCHSNQVDQSPKSTAVSNQYSKNKSKSYNNIDVTLTLEDEYEQKKHDFERDPSWTPHDEKYKKSKDRKLAKKCLSNPLFQEYLSNPCYRHLEDIYRFLESNHFSAKDVVYDFRHLFSLCRFLNLRPSECNKKKVGQILIDIMDKRVDKESIIKIQELKRVPFAKLKQYSLLPKDRLKMKAVVVLQDLRDFKIEDIWGKREKPGRTNGYYKQKAPFGSKPFFSAQTFTSDHVKKETSESYLAFKKIVIRRIGSRVVHCRTYAKLGRGTRVYAKDFSNPLVGWVRGTISRMEGTYKYVVELDCGETHVFTRDQLRPLPEETRLHRQVKPKHLLDL